jgi:hypothetical protein
MELLHGLGKLDDAFEAFDCVNKNPDLQWQNQWHTRMHDKYLLYEAIGDI